RAEDLVAHPAADRRCHVDQRRRGAPHQVGLLIGEAQALDHVVDDERLHTVVAEALPHFDQEDGAEGLRLRDGWVLGGHVFPGHWFKSWWRARTHRCRWTLNGSQPGKGSASPQRS